jgi:hypothetical protein
MTRDETLTILRARSALTSQPYGDEAIDAWHQALAEWTLDECRTALTRAARAEKRITVAHLTERLPHRSPIPAHEPRRPPPTEEERTRIHTLVAELKAQLAQRTDLR